MLTARLLSKKDDKFRIWWDEKAGSISVDIEGFWDDEDMRHFLPAFRAATMRSTERHGDGRVLIDLTNTGVMANSLFAATLAKGAKPLPRSTRVAIVVGSTLQKLQMKRVAAGDEITDFFASREDAAYWLSGATPPMIPPTPFE